MTAALEGNEWSAARPGRTVPAGKTRYPFYRRLRELQGRYGGAKYLVPTRIRSRTVQPVAQPLYQLSYPAHNYSNKICYLRRWLWSALSTILWRNGTYVWLKPISCSSWTNRNKKPSNKKKDILFILASCPSFLLTCDFWYSRNCPPLLVIILYRKIWTTWLQVKFYKLNVPDIRLPPRSKYDIRSSGMLRKIDW